MNRPASSSQKGYVLLGLMLMVTVILIALAMEAPRIAQQIKRDKEEELVHRGKDYATAIKRFVHKSGGQYPLSVDQLENTNHIRFLRKKYKDPMTGETDWKMVHAGEAEIKIPAPNPGLNPSTNNPGISTSPPPPPPPNSNGSLQTKNIGNGPTIGGGAIIGVASVSKGAAIKEFNDKDHYNEWYFVYDLRLEQSGGTGVTVAAPRAGGASASQAGGQGSTGQPGAGGANPAPSPTPTPPPVPN
ncbi:MAG TPA: hypothetical protein VFT65_19270 [Candidatus Angelobacter sp.]|nr:hypothetical protein [Candidatus Angelobacter sp.]